MRITCLLARLSSGVTALWLLSLIPYWANGGHAVAQQQQGNIPGVTVVHNPRGETEIYVTREQFGANGNMIVHLPVTSEKRPTEACFDGVGLFYITPGGYGMMFRKPRAELPFTVEERPSPQDKAFYLDFTTESCHITIKVEKEYRDGDKWLPLAPIEDTR